jgi:predicted nucleic acid-binding protein
MIVVSDTTPLNYLILLDAAHVLPALFGRVHAPSAVIRELAHPRSPELVRRWTDSLPEWLTVQQPTRIDPALRLGPGEAAAIALAEELKAEWACWMSPRVQGRPRAAVSEWPAR